MYIFLLCILWLLSICQYLKTLLWALVQVDSDKAIMVTFKHDDKLQENSECAFQVISSVKFAQYRIFLTECAFWISFFPPGYVEEIFFNLIFAQYSLRLV
jgi:hypothetical protein